MILTAIKVPDIGDFQDVEVIEVICKIGEKVVAEDPLISVESDKATMEIPSPTAGVVRKIRIKVGDKISEGSLILEMEKSEVSTNKDNNQKNENKQIDYYKILVKYQVTGNYLRYMNFKESIANMDKIVHFEKEEIKVMPKKKGIVIADGVLSVIRLP